MHELSLARSLHRLVLEHCPRGQRVKQVLVEAGPLQAIDRTAMGWAWEAVRSGVAEDAELEIDFAPWNLHCPDCDHTWQADSLDVVCQCGSYGAYPEGGEQFLLTGLEVECEGEHRARTRC